MVLKMTDFLFIFLSVQLITAQQPWIQNENSVCGIFKPLKKKGECYLTVHLPDDSGLDISVSHIKAM